MKILSSFLEREVFIVIEYIPGDQSRRPGGLGEAIKQGGGTVGLAVTKATLPIFFLLILALIVIWNSKK